MTVPRTMAFVTAAVALLACTRGNASGGGTDGAAASAQPAPTLSASAAAEAALTSTMAESRGMLIARQRWPQYHPRMATAQRLGSGYIVRIQMLEPVGANVVLDMQGNFVDGGTSSGEH